MRPILSVRDLASQLGKSPARLHEIADAIKPYYRESALVDKGNPQKIRRLTIPRGELKEIQRRINRNILRQIALGAGVHGGVAGRSPRSNAEAHLGQPCVVNLDVRNFFPSARHHAIYRMFRKELGYGRDVARLLTRLTTFESKLPQGAPTSTGVGNLLLALPVDRPVDVEAERRGVTYTRFVDDVALSGRNPRPLINVVGRMLSRRGLRLHRDKAKLKITPRSSPQEMTGLIVNGRNGPSVSRKRRDRIRAAIFALRNVIDDAALHTEVNSIRGRISYVQQFNPGAAKRLQKYLESTLATRG